MKPYTVMIIDDERLAREEIKEALKAYPDFCVSAEASNADEAASLIKSVSPQLIFLDIQMPERSGLELLESMDHLPEIVFVTAYDQYALDAFEWGALDYLVKPVRWERFQKTVERLRERLAASSKHPPTRFFIREGDKYFFVDHKDISLVESVGNYVRLYIKDQKHYLKRSLNQMETVLDPDLFFRINRTEIINLTEITHAKKTEKGRLTITLQNGQQLELSARRLPAFMSKNISIS